MKMTQAGAAFWAWLAAVLLGPFLFTASGSLGAHVFGEVPEYEMFWRDIKAMLFFGLPLWGAAIIASSIWVGRTMHRDEDPLEATRCIVVLSLVGGVVSLTLGFIACTVITSN